ncbi:hypothetical protein [Sporosarcina sp. D27]|uniref:hypothetical protein n=1 Tax=Sporosarcina sp. D27 TaxID=1382305 RepID=UPI0004AC5AE0|nr:hypothetical protein [Sporosarcina sp. D27]
MMKYFSVFLMVVSMLFLLMGCTATSTGNPTAKDILKEDKEADIIKVGSLIYTKNNNPVTESAYERPNLYKIGDIKKQTTRELFFQDFYASQLPKGTEVFSTEEYSHGRTPYVLIVESSDEYFEYHALIEG